MRSSTLPFYAIVYIAMALPVSLSAAPEAGNTAVSFAEHFALAGDRATVLAELIPGTEDYYYYHCLHAQNTGQLEKVQPILDAWAKRFNGQTPSHRTMESRQRLLEFGTKPAETLRWLQHHLDILHNHARDAEPGAITHPAALDNAKISFDTFLAQVRERPDLVRLCTPVGREKLVALPLNPQHRRELLNTLTTPDIPGLVELIAAELKAPDSPGFGRLAVCARLTLDQLNALRMVIPDLAADNAYVAAVASRLAATPDADRASDPAADAAALARLHVFANDAVTLKVAIKNVGRLTLRVYDVDAAAWFRQTGEPVTPVLNLDGLVANSERTLDFTAFPPCAVMSKPSTSPKPHLPVPTLSSASATASAAAL